MNLAYLFCFLSIVGICPSQIQANSPLQSEIITQGTGGPRVDIVSYSWNFYPPKFRDPTKYRKIKDNFDVLYCNDLYRYTKNFRRKNSKNLHKVVYIDLCGDLTLPKIPSEKLVGFCWEPHKIDPNHHIMRHYDRIYTFDDDLVDNKRVFKYHYPVLEPMVDDIPSFHEKLLCAMIVIRWVPERTQIVDFFLTKPSDALHVYGGFPYSYDNEMYKGSIPGYPSSVEKWNTFKKYRFAICFENTWNINGYVTEKIFDVFAGGCVPIYRGPDNILKYIPKDCFIDYRRFKNNEEMYAFITSMKEEEYNRYLENIRVFLQSDAAKLYSVEAFEEILYEAISY